jgi:hypothetical protein
MDKKVQCPKTFFQQCLNRSVHGASSHQHYNELDSESRLERFLPNSEEHHHERRHPAIMIAVSDHAFDHRMVMLMMMMMQGSVSSVLKWILVATCLATH